MKLRPKSVWIRLIEKVMLRSFSQAISKITITPNLISLVRSRIELSFRKKKSRSWTKLLLFTEKIGSSKGTKEWLKMLWKLELELMQNILRTSKSWWKNQQRIRTKSISMDSQLCFEEGINHTFIHKLQTQKKKKIGFYWSKTHQFSP